MFADSRTPCNFIKFKSSRSWLVTMLQVCCRSWPSCRDCDWGHGWRQGSCGHDSACMVTGCREWDASSSLSSIVTHSPPSSHPLTYNTCLQEAWWTAVPLTMPLDTSTTSTITFCDFLWTGLTSQIVCHARPLKCCKLNEDLLQRATFEKSTWVVT